MGLVNLTFQAAYNASSWLDFVSYKGTGSLSMSLVITMYVLPVGKILPRHNA